MKAKVQAVSNFLMSDTVKYFDWVVSIGIIIYGLWLLYSTGINSISVTTIAVGILGAFLAKIRPAVLIKNYLDKKILRRG